MLGNSDDGHAMHDENVEINDHKKAERKKNISNNSNSTSLSSSRRTFCAALLLAMWI